MNRISTSQLFSKSRDNVLNAKEKEASSAEKSGSLKALNRPSDSPSEWVIANNLKDDVAVRENLAKNVTLATHVLTATENVMAQAQDIVQRAYELALSTAGGDTKGNKTSQHVLPEAEGLFSNLIQSLNSKFGNRTLLGGYKTDRPAFDGLGNYLGDDGNIEIEIDRGLKVPVNISAQEAIYGVGLKDGVDIIANFRNFLEGLQLDDKEMIKNSLNGFGLATDQLSLSRTRIAGSMTEMERALNTHGTNNIQSRDAASKLEEADPIKVFSDLARDQTVLRAAMDSTHKLLTGSPPDILFK